MLYYIESMIKIINLVLIKGSCYIKVNIIAYINLVFVDYNNCIIKTNYIFIRGNFNSKWGS